MNAPIASPWNPSGFQRSWLASVEDERLLAEVTASSTPLEQELAERLRGATQADFEERTSSDISRYALLQEAIEWATDLDLEGLSSQQIQHWLQVTFEVAVRGEGDMPETSYSLSDLIGAYVDTTFGQKADMLNTVERYHDRIHANADTLKFYLWLASRIADAIELSDASGDVTLPAHLVKTVREFLNDAGESHAGRKN
jgi:hypothetical protein